jgi:hypothetical protein
LPLQFALIVSELDLMGGQCKAAEVLAWVVLLQDESVVVFPDRSPAAAAHILVIPR